MVQFDCGVKPAQEVQNQSLRVVQQTVDTKQKRNVCDEVRGSVTIVDL